MHTHLMKNLPLTFFFFICSLLGFSQSSPLSDYENYYHLPDSSLTRSSIQSLKENILTVHGNNIVSFGFHQKHNILLIGTSQYISDDDIDLFLTQKGFVFTRVKRLPLPGMKYVYNTKGDYKEIQE